jgi:hypothetical protein
MKGFQRTKEVEFERQKIAFIHSVDPTAHLTAHIPMKLHSLSFFPFLATYSQKWQLKNLGSTLLHITSDHQLIGKMN